MKSLEWVLFDINEKLHYENVLSGDKYITVESVGFTIAMIFVAMPVIIKLNDYLNELDPYLKYTPWIIISICFLVLYIVEGYIQILISLLLIGFYLIILSNPQYKHIKNHIERFF